MPQIEVTFDIDANGIVNVSAKDKASGKQQQIRIQSSGGLSDADIERMVKEAEQFASADADRKAKVEAQNEADSTVYNTEKTLHEHKDKVPQEDQDLIKVTSAASAAPSSAVPSTAAAAFATAASGRVVRLHTLHALLKQNRARDARRWGATPPPPLARGRSPSILFLVSELG